MTLRLVAEHADIWNGFGPPEEFRHRNEVLDRWCSEVGRDPAAVERSVTLDEEEEVEQLEEFLSAGAEHIILGRAAPFDLTPVKQLLESARG
jgi:alkanesulfonate monooxygenase SsuD/methylene tetrahydromethanopterin reductase-like flavin-dependent oxidoreductase (luciferase family)